VQQGGVKAVLALMSGHSAAEILPSNGIAALCRMVNHADWASVQADAGNILAAAIQGLSAARVVGSFRHGNCLDTLSLLIRKDASIVAQVVAAGAFALAIKAMRADLGTESVQRHGCSLLHHLAASPSIAAVPRLQLHGAQEAVVTAMESHGSSAAVQEAGIQALEALLPLIRRHLCATVEAGSAAHPEKIGSSFAAGVIASIAGRPALPERVLADGAGAAAGV